MALTAQDRQSQGNEYIKQAYKELLGRDPTPAELASAFPSLGTDKNIPDVGTMRAFVAQQAVAEQNNPQNLQQKQQADLLAKAPEHYGAVDQMFQSSLGRAATDAEKQHFGSLLASGGLDQYQLSQFLSQTPEAQNSADKSFREGLTNDLQTQDQRYYQDKVLPSIQQSFLQSGRSLDSSGYAAMLAKAAQQQNTNREGFLSNLSASQYGSNKSAATSDYQTLLNNYYNNQNYNRSRTDSLTDQTTQRLNQFQDYNIQQQAYDKYLRNYGKRSPNTGYGALAGGIVGAGLGAYLGSGNPTAISTGYQVGSGAGGGAGGLF
jgi:hypothetical protein